MIEIKRHLMKACVYLQYGPPEVVNLTEVEKPMPKANEILLKVHYSTVNRTDCGFRSAEYVVSRLFSGLLKPKSTILGNEFSGVIEKVGSEVENFRVGDKIFGYNDITFGGHAEYICLSEKSNIALIPENIEIDQAAAICEGAHYALNNIRAAKLKAGNDVLVYGATGAIGSSAVQLLKYFKMNVTAVCSTENVEVVKALGAEKVIDYRKENAFNTPSSYSFIFDAVGKSSFRACKNALKRDGIYISTELGKNGANVWLALLTPFISNKKVLFPLPKINQEDVQFLAHLAKSGYFKPLIDRTFKMVDIVEAHRYVGNGQKIGNVLIEIE